MESCGSLISDAQSKSPNFSVKMKEEDKEENRGGYGFVNALHAIVKEDMDVRIKKAIDFFLFFF